MKRFAELSEQEVLALAIANEDEDSRIYRSFADALRQSYPDTAEMYDKMAQEEIGHHDMLLELYRKKFGDFLPLIRRQNVKGFVERRPIWLNRPLAIDATRKFAHNTWSTFLVGLAAAIGAGISMAFAEALSDDGSLTGRGAPVVRGAVTGSMTAIGGLGHALPYLIPNFFVATSLAFVVVAIELAVISWIRMRYMDTPFLQAAFQVVVGGALVFAAGILIGNS